MRQQSLQRLIGLTAICSVLWATLTKPWSPLSRTWLFLTVDRLSGTRIINNNPGHHSPGHDYSSQSTDFLGLVSWTTTLVTTLQDMIISHSRQTFWDSYHQQRVQITDLPQMVCRGRKQSQSTGSFDVNRIKQNRRRSFVERSVGQSSSSTCQPHNQCRNDITYYSTLAHLLRIYIIM